MDGYVAQWGLAGPGHPLVLLLVAALFGMTPDGRAPAALGPPRTAVDRLAGLLIGLAWPYLVGSRSMPPSASTSSPSGPSS